MAEKTSAGGGGTNTFILKRMKTKHRPDIKRCALREIYFGQLLRGQSNYPQFITHFIKDEDYWLVFKDEGTCLQAFLYAYHEGLLRPSSFWHRMRTTPRGAISMKGIIYQVIQNVADLHRQNVIHRDIKPSNILINGEGVTPRVILADFSSAIHSNVDLKEHYGDRGPTVDEATFLYAPPEVLLTIDESYFTEDEPPTSSAPYFAMRPQSYDIWSIGVLFLELILGTADVFSVDQRTSAMITQRLGRNDLKRRALFMASLADYCIYKRPLLSSEDASGKAGTSAKNRKRSEELSSLGSDLIGMAFPLQSDNQRDVNAFDSLLQSPVKLKTCSVNEFGQAILRRDPLGKGFNDKCGLDLLYRLLHFDPMKRINLSEALMHPYFRGPYQNARDCSDHATIPERREPHDEPVPPLVQTPSTVIDLVEVKDLYPLYLFSHHFNKTAEPAGRGLERIDEEASSSTSKIDELIQGIDFMCPKCKRKFSGDWFACQRHLKSRQHGNYCLYLLHNQPNGLSLSASQIGYTSMGEESDKAVSKLHRRGTCKRVADKHHLDMMRVSQNRLLLESLLPSCLSEHSLLFNDDRIGWCDLKGRRAYVEDMHALYFGDSYIFTGVFDGHFGSLAARYSAENIYANFLEILSNRLYNLSTSTIEQFDLGTSSQASLDQQIEILRDANGGDGMEWLPHLLASPNQAFLSLSVCPEANSTEPPLFNNDWDIMNCFSIDSINSEKSRIQQNLSAEDLLDSIRGAFLLTNQQLQKRYSESSADSTLAYMSGSTASIALLLPDNLLLLASVGDSRMVTCCYFSFDSTKWSYSAAQLSIDHTPKQIKEYNRVVERGGFIEGDPPRVNGKLAVTRSLGDPLWADMLSAEPDVLLLSSNVSYLSEEYVSLSNAVADGPCSEYFLLLQQLSGVENVSVNVLHPLFLVIGSDGLWDVFANDELVDLVCLDLINALCMTDKDEESHGSRSPPYPSDIYQLVSRHLAQEALLRGSSDNIGVSVLNLRSTAPP
eukprot:gene1208-1318_t